ncbi:ribonuclease M5 [Sedimentibacter sp. zth1]|uniref:ribonuclease M5 n=1 Tax=Sedimentibacter sp. zth1 TaxID=2816908 RepID=UPI001A922FF6|nr:ribonuclease M5 [Sedimentibacter sp. zth1]QSX04763.1 ribonuclease M5 [Sedimentibacter sp. zth1]
MIKEIIVVEGKDDISAVKRAVDAEIIATSGLGLTQKTIDLIKTASANRGVIILTDPDFPGKKIRNIVSSQVKNCKHAFIPRNKANKNGNIGVENATPDVIREALANARAEVTDGRTEFKSDDMIYYELVGNDNASKRRAKLGDMIGIGYCSAKQFVKRLNNYGIIRDELETAITEINDEEIGV